MIPYNLHRQIPFIRRPFFQRDKALLERNQAIAERDMAIAERDEARALCASTDIGERVDWADRMFFVSPGHFYSPIVNPIEASRHLAALEQAPAPTSLKGIAIDNDRLISEWNGLAPFLRDMPFPKFKTSRFRYAFENPFYSWGDGSVLHALLRKYRPRRIVEVGCGWSTACTVDTIEHYLDGACELICVEPYPNSLKETIGTTRADIRILEMGVQSVALDTFERLRQNDILFIDSTHVLRTGGDVCFELFEVLPRIASGVLVHFHDIFWPFEYPRVWAIDENRSWNELYAIRAFLTNNDEWEVIVFNDYLAKTHADLIQATYPPFMNSPGGALWLRRR
jgi:predicted O-methyltransferase YrrM